MATPLRCPHCGREFELDSAVRDQVRAELEPEMQARVTASLAAATQQLATRQAEVGELQSRIREASQRELEMLGQLRAARQLGENAELEYERRLTEAARRIREQERKQAEDLAHREAQALLDQKEQELARARGAVAEALGREASILRREREIGEREQQVSLDLERRLADEVVRIRDREAQAASERFSREAAEKVRVAEEQVSAARQRLGEAAAREADVLRRERGIEEREQALAVTLERRLSEEQRNIRSEQERIFEERLAAERDSRQLAEEEQRQRVDGLQRTIDELQRRLRQGSQQAQGEAQEVVLAILLGDAFPDDTIADVPHGAAGADLLHYVRSADGQQRGSLVWESKRTKAWSDGWLAKVRDDQRAAGASGAIIVSQALPPDVKHFGLRDGVWVCAWPYAVPLGVALRAGVLEVSFARRASENRGEKVQLLYDYLIGSEFRNRVGGFVEAFREMQDDLEREKRAILTTWRRRERQMERALTNVTAFYGDLQGIAGNQLKDLPLLALAPAEEPSGDSYVDLTSGHELEASSPGVDGELVRLLLSLLPENGDSVASLELSELFKDHVFVARGERPSESDYERCKDALVAAGLAAKGKGRGPSLRRVSVESKTGPR